MSHQGNAEIREAIFENIQEWFPNNENLVIQLTEREWEDRLDGKKSAEIFGTFSVTWLCSDCGGLGVVEYETREGPPRLEDCTFCFNSAGLADERRIKIDNLEDLAQQLDELGVDANNFHTIIKGEK